MSSNNFSGFRLNSLEGFSKLRELELASCGFVGIVEPSLSNLRELTLFENSLEGPLDFLANASQVVNLRISYNNFSGAIPASILRSTVLAALDMSHNRLSGTLPGDLKSLFFFFFFFFSLKGDAFANAVNLTTLDLSFNSLTGPVPNFSAKPHLLFILLNSNNLTGSLPDLENVPSLLRLDLGSNSISGTIPPSL